MGTHGFQKSAMFLVIAGIFATATASKFTVCRAKAEGILNGTIANDSSFDIFYHGPLRGFDATRPRPITLTYEGCVDACGSGSQLNDPIKAFGILTTWILPAVALFFQLPYEALSVKRRRNFEAFLNWVGAPATALTATIYNIHLVRKCVTRVSESSNTELESIARDSYFVLSCINQYEYPSKLVPDHRDERDRALFYGLQRPLEVSDAQNQQDIEKLKELLAHLAFQLRLQRRRGVWPLAINVLWFLMAFIISIVTAFADLGDNTTAHSLALGLLLSWLPILVVMMIVDRNPICATRCKVLIERWLYNVDKIHKHHHSQSLSKDPLMLWGEQSPRTGGDGPANSNPDRVHSIGEFIGQGRRLRYNGVANAILNCKKWNQQASQTSIHLDLTEFRKQLITRPLAWWVIFALSFVIVSISFGMAFMVSFRTPTAGLGCRSLIYMIFYLPGLCSFVVLAISKEPHRYLQRVLICFNFFAAATLILIMGFQVTNGLNNCKCKSSIFGGSDYGRYMDFENAIFYREAHGIEKYWIPATVVGGLSPIVVIGWALRRWGRASALWRVEETHCPNRAEDSPLMWLT